jgi:general secretion pathway protein D
MHIKIILNGLLLVFILTGCAAQRSYKEGLSLLDSGKQEEGLEQLEKAYKLDLNNNEYKTQYFKRRDSVIYQWLSQAETAKKNALWEDAENIYRRILKVSPDNSRAKTGLSSINTEKKQAQIITEAKILLENNDAVGAGNKIRLVLAESPSQPDAMELKRQIEAKIASSKQSSVILKTKLARPITIEFKDSPLNSVLDSISKIAGVNFIIDKDVRADLKANLFIRDARMEDVIRFVLVANQLEQKALNENTLFIYPNTPLKQKDFQELQIKNFYLTNANAKTVGAMLKSFVKSKDIYVDEKLNLIVMRDTAEAIRVAERLIIAQDIAEPEVMLEVEVLEVGSNVLENIGFQYPTQASIGLVGGAGTTTSSTGTTTGSAGTPGSASLDDIRNGGTSLARVSISDPAFVINMLHQNSDTNLLANPRIRVKNHEKANVHIGDKLPVITNNTTANSVITQSINYLDVGLKLEVEPTVYLDNEVGIKVGMEVSSITKQIQNTNGSLTYQIGTRNAATVLRLKDGETQILAGLINKEDRKSANSVPILGEIPILGRLFSTHSDSTSKTEVVLLITPRVIRNIVRPESPIEEFTSGTESVISLERMEINRANTTKDNMVSEASTSMEIKRANTAKDNVVSDASAAMEINRVNTANDSMAAKATPSLASVSDSQPKPMTPPLPLPPALGKVQLALEMPPQVQSDKPFTVKINLVAEGLQNALIDMSFDPAKLKVVNISEGELFKKQDGKTQFLQQVQDKAGRINLSVLRQGNVQGEGTLASITFQPLESGAGPTQLRVGTVFRDAQGRVLPANILSAATVEITK